MNHKNILSTIGNTPNVRLGKLFPNNEVWIKLEKLNIGGSIKDRIALAMIEDAEEKGLLKKGGTIIEPTSGNTGVGLAMVAAVKGYKAIMVMPDSMSMERRQLIAAYGAQLVLTPRAEGIKGTIVKAEELAKEIKDAWIPLQFENMSNPAIHAKTTGTEILKDFPEGIDYFVSGVGTGGHISGIGKVLKEKYPNAKVVGVEPELSAVLSGGEHSPHPIQGIATGFIPKTMNVEILDKIITISKEEAFDYTRRLAREEGILAGISTGASVAAVAKLIEEKKNVGRVLTINYDTGERYLSVEDLF